jgi:replicative DNA helicase
VSDVQKGGRVPPHNLEAEQACLGAILLDPENTMDQVLLQLKPDDFYRHAHQRIFSAIKDLVSKNEAIDLITLTDELSAQKLLDQVGGASYVSSLTSVVPTSANVQYYANIVRDNSLRRTLLRISADISNEAFDESMEISHVIDDAERKIFDITDGQVSEGFKKARDIVNLAVTTIESYYKNQGNYTGIASGFPVLDDMTDGFQNSEFIIIGARPSIGKTALALTMTRNICLRHKVPTGFFSLEMADMQLMQRMISMETHISGGNLRKGLLKASDFHSIMDVASEIYDAPLYISDTPNMRLLDLKAQARRMKAQHDVKIVFIDYISIITPENNMMDRHLQVAEISRSLKALARELEIPVVALSQVSRDSEGKAPHLASIRESGAIEQDADVVMFLHRDRSHDKEMADANQGIETQLILAKNRNGPVGTVDINFLPSYAEYVSLDRHGI